MMNNSTENTYQITKPKSINVLKDPNQRQVFKTLQGRIEDEKATKKSLSVKSYNYFLGKNTEEIQLTNYNTDLNKSKESTLGANKSELCEELSLIQDADEQGSKTFQEKKTIFNRFSHSTENLKHLKYEHSKNQLNTDRLQNTQPTLIHKEKNITCGDLPTKSVVNLTSTELVKNKSSETLDNGFYKNVRAPNETTANFLRQQRRIEFLDKNKGYKYLSDEKFYGRDREMKVYPTFHGEIRINKGKINKILAGTNFKECTSDPKRHAKISKGLGNI